MDIDGSRGPSRSLMRLLKDSRAALSGYTGP